MFIFCKQFFLILTAAMFLALNDTHSSVLFAQIVNEYNDLLTSQLENQKLVSTFLHCFFKQLNLCVPL